MAKKLIDSFTQTSGFGFLSNFYASTISIDGKLYPTVEHAYQAHKTINDSSRELIRKSGSPQQAKKLGRALPLRQDWDDVKLPLMRKFLVEKFKNPLLRPLLLETGDAELVYKNTWNDKFWGVCRGSGENWLGRLLEEIREEARKEYADDQRHFSSEETV